MNLYHIRNKATLHADAFDFYAAAGSPTEAVALMPGCLGGDFVVIDSVKLLTENLLMVEPDGNCDVMPEYLND